MNRSKILKLRRAIEEGSASLSDEIAQEVPELYPRWAADTAYTVGERISYDGVLYKVLQQHTSQTTWTPPDSPSLFAQVLTSDTEILPWVQPDSTNPYMTGDKVLYEGDTWESEIDNNVWAPGVYGWKKL